MVKGLYRTGHLWQEWLYQQPGVNSGISTSEIDNIYNYPVTYSDYATVDKTLSNGFAAVKMHSINIVPDHGTPMRSAIYKSVNEINARGRSGSVKPLFFCLMEIITGMVIHLHEERAIQKVRVWSR